MYVREAFGFLKGSELRVSSYNSYKVSKLRLSGFRVSGLGLSF